MGPVSFGQSCPAVGRSIVVSLTPVNTPCGSPELMTHEYLSFPLLLRRTYEGRRLAYLGSHLVQKSGHFLGQGCVVRFQETGIVSKKPCGFLSGNLEQVLVRETGNA